MSTRCLTRVFEGDTEILCLYRHCDGYPDGHGQELIDFAATKRVVNGHSSRSKLTRSQAANGAGRLAAMLVAAFADDDVSVYPVGSDDCWEEYEYHVKCPDFRACTAAQDAGNHNGLRIVVEAFEVHREGKVRKLERVGQSEGEDR